MGRKSPSPRHMAPDHWWQPCSRSPGMSFDLRGEDHSPCLRQAESSKIITMPAPVACAFLIDSVMPTYDTSIAEHILVAADPTTTFAAVRTLDLLTVHSPLLDLSLWLRALPARFSGQAAPRLPKLVIDPDMGLPGWTFLGQQPGREIVFGAVGRFWQPTIEWRDVPPSDFKGFDEPGWGKIAANFSILPYGASATLLTYECRTVTTDPDSRRRFLRYWHLIRPFVGHVLRATLRQIRENAAASSMPSESELRPGR
jgi:hypothetical protein